MLDERIYESYIGILKEEMVPAMGCTEPIIKRNKETN